MSDIKLIDGNDLREQLDYLAYAFDDPSSLTIEMGRRAFNNVVGIIDETEPINPESLRQKAQWISTQNPNHPIHWHDKCSACGWLNTRDAQIGKGNKATRLKYCPCCGAKMQNIEF